MEIYPINEVERLTGIKAHTLRVWEKRYNVMAPHRTATNIRYYDDDQLRKLLNISALLAEGYKISYLFSLTDEEINDLILFLKGEPPTDSYSNVYVNDLTMAMSAFDEPTFNNACTSLLARYGVYEAIVRVIYPFLHKTGLLWSVNELIPAQEHFATNIIKRKLLSAIDGLPYGTGKKKKFLLALPPDEFHEVGLLFSDYLIRSAGFESIYLGQNITEASLVAALNKVNPDYFVTFIVQGGDISGSLRLFSELKHSFGAMEILLCSNLDNADMQQLQSVTVLKDPADIFPFLAN